MKKVLITDDVHPVLLKGLQDLGFETTYLPEITLEETRTIVHAYQGLVINSKIKAYADFLANTKDLEFIGRLGSGLDIIDLEVARDMDIAVISAPEGNCNAVAEHALGMMMALLHKICQGNHEVKNGLWQREDNRGIEIMGRTVGIIGFGHTGPAFAEKLSGLGVRTLVYDRFKTDLERKAPALQVVSLEEIQQEADFISLHVSLNDTSRYMINDAFVAACRKPFFLINTSRGKVVDTRALIKGLSSGKVRGACLDVFENEKTSTYSDEEKKLYSALHHFPNVLVTPHVAGWTVESKQRIAEVLLTKISELKKP